MTVHLHIERVVVEGLSLERHAAADVQAALHARLAELIAHGAAPEALAGTIEFAARDGAAALGARAASSVYAALPRASVAGGVPRPGVS